MDDEEQLLSVAYKILAWMGYQVTVAQDGKQAIKLYREAMSAESPFDLVILDLTVPGGMGGLQTIHELLKIDQNVKAVVSSGYYNDPVMANFKEYGFCGVVPKPYTLNDMVEALNKIFYEDR